MKSMPRSLFYAVAVLGVAMMGACGDPVAPRNPGGDTDEPPPGDGGSTSTRVTIPPVVR